MATPSLTRHQLPGSLGDILIDVRSAHRSAPTPVVVLMHGFKGFKDWGFFPPLADRLARAGFAVVSYNASGSGVDHDGNFSYPERFGHNTFSAELSDARTVLDAVDAGRLDLATPTSVGLVGHSRGGGIAVLITAEQQRISCLVTWAAIASPFRWPSETRRRWRESGALAVTNQRTGAVLPLYSDMLDDVEQNAAVLDIQAAAARISVPWLVLHGTTDETVPLEEGEALAASASRPQFIKIERGSHTFGAVHPFGGETAELTGVFDATLRFLSRHLS
jgi:pimeloyl-ACP methyl ester carboxylesterase